MTRLRTLVAPVLLAAAAVGCGGDSAPTQANAPSPNLAGTWRGTVVETTGDRRTLDMTMTLTQSPGSSSIDGTVVTSLADSRQAGTISNGKQSGLSVELYATYVDAAGRQIAYNRYEGQANAEGAAISGNAFNVMAASNPSAFGTWSVRRDP